MDTVTIAVLFAAFFGLGWWLSTRKRGAASTAGPASDYATHLTPKPLKPSFAVDEWDGYSGMQAAVCVELADDACYPLILAGTVPPSQTTHTFSTATASQTEIVLPLYSGLSDRRDPTALIERVSVGPIPVTGEAIRQVEVSLSVDAEGAISVSAASSDGAELTCSVAEAGSMRVPVGPLR